MIGNINIRFHANVRFPQSNTTPDQFEEEIYI
jgi:hypothetical protein